MNCRKCHGLMVDDYDTMTRLPFRRCVNCGGQVGEPEELKQPEEARMPRGQWSPERRKRYEDKIAARKAVATGPPASAPDAWVMEDAGKVQPPTLQPTDATFRFEVTCATLLEFALAWKHSYPLLEMAGLQMDPDGRVMTVRLAQAKWLEER